MENGKGFLHGIILFKGSYSELETLFFFPLLCFTPSLPALPRSSSISSSFLFCPALLTLLTLPSLRVTQGTLPTLMSQLIVTYICPLGTKTIIKSYLYLFIAFRLFNKLIIMHRLICNHFTSPNNICVQAKIDHK